MRNCALHIEFGNESCFQPSFSVKVVSYNKKIEILFPCDSKSHVSDHETYAYSNSQTFVSARRHEISNVWLPVYHPVLNLRSLQLLLIGNRSIRLIRAETCESNQAWTAVSPDFKAH